MGRVLIVGASGTIGRAAVQAFLDRGHDVTAVLRPTSSVAFDAKVKRISAEVTEPLSLQEALQSLEFDAVVCCLASRTGAPDDAWAIDHAATVGVIETARALGFRHFILVSAICVQRPQLDFQKAKLAAEAVLQSSGVRYSIVRPTAFFKSLAGQIERVRRGKDFMVFADGEHTRCKPISDRDLANFLVDCFEQENLHNRILPIGGPGPAISPRVQVELLSELTGKPVKLKKVPIFMMRTIVKVLSVVGAVIPKAKRASELARIGLYYGTESMLVHKDGRYSEEATPSYGQDTLRSFYARVLAGEEKVSLGDHGVF